MIVSCPGCEVSLKVPDNRAGAVVKCPKCGERIEVPAPAKRSAPTREERISGSAPAGTGQRKRSGSEQASGNAIVPSEK